MNIIRIIILLIATGTLISCNGNNDKPPVKEEKEAHQHEEEEGNTVTITAAQIAAIDIKLGTLEHKNLSTSIRVTGKLEVPNQNKASVTSLYSGVLRTLDIHPGSPVRKGQVLATIANTDFINIQQELISINSRLKLAVLEKDRQKELVAGNAAPLKNLQRAESDFNSLKAQQQALQQHLATLGISPASVGKGTISSSLSITAPISGTISEIYAQIGSRVDPSTPLASIVNNSSLHLDLFIYEKDLPSIQMGQTIHFTLTNNPGKEYDARIFSVGTAFADASKAIPIHAEVLGEKTGLIDGMGVTAIISIGSATKPAVPNEAIVSNAGKDYIFIQSNKKAEHHSHEEGEHNHAEEDGILFEKLQVVKGISDLGYTEINPVTPLPDNAKIITKGAFFVMAKMTNTGGHEH